jgi:transcriptional regulator with XRE-family HTH domain
MTYGLTTEISVADNQTVKKARGQQNGEEPLTPPTQHRGAEVVTELSMRQPAFQRVRGWRRELGITQTELAKVAGMNKETVNRYERGANVQRDTEHKILVAIQDLNRQHGGAEIPFEFEPSSSRRALEQEAGALLKQMSEYGLERVMAFLRDGALMFPRDASPGSIPPGAQSAPPKVHKARGKR